MGGHEPQSIPCVRKGCDHGVHDGMRCQTLSLYGNHGASLHFMISCGEGGAALITSAARVVAIMSSRSLLPHRVVLMALIYRWLSPASSYSCEPAPSRWLPAC